MKMQPLLLILLLTSIRAQTDSCPCSCCRSSGAGQSCNPTTLPSINVQSCSLESCLAQCRARYYECQGNTSTDYISTECVSTTTPQFNCRCDCCNTGSISCVPLYVGNATAYLCQTGSCSIACQRQYPNQCRADQTGLTQGTCTNLITATSTTTTTIGSWLGNTCKCTCCQTSPYCPTIDVGVTSALACSTNACTQACQNQYPSSCFSSLNISQTSGTCISDISANTFCSCQCCEANRCINYKINTSGGCTTCDSICRQNTPCANTTQVTVQTCSTNNANMIFFPWMNFILLISISAFFRY